MSAGPTIRHDGGLRVSTPDGYGIEVSPAHPPGHCVCQVSGPGLAVTRVGLIGAPMALTWAALVIGSARAAALEPAPPASGRWSARIKEQVLRDIAGGRMSEAEARGVYGLSTAELEEWRQRYLAHGIDGLKTGKLQELAR